MISTNNVFIQVPIKINLTFKKKELFNYLSLFICYFIHFILSFSKRGGGGSLHFKSFKLILSWLRRMNNRNGD